MKRGLLLSMLLLAACASPLPQTPPAGQSGAVSAPQPLVGDIWRYAARDGYTGMAKGELEYRIDAITSDTINVTLQQGDRTANERYTRDWNWRERPMTNLQNFRYEPAYPALPFPLEAGKTWQSYIRATDPGTGQVNRVRIDGKVLGGERVKVPAGEFDALKVRRLVYAGNHDYFRGEEHIAEFDWYAPKLGQIVKHVSTSGHQDKAQSCDDFFSDCNWIKGDWNVVELVNHQRGGGKP